MKITIQKTINILTSGDSNSITNNLGRLKKYLRCLCLPSKCKIRHSYLVLFFWLFTAFSKNNNCVYSLLNLIT